jgi:hypothetical protein
MPNPVTAHSLLARGRYSETGRLREVVICPLTRFHITQPINMIRLMSSYGGLLGPDPGAMVLQHKGFMKHRRAHGVEVELLPLP